MIQRWWVPGPDHLVISGFYDGTIENEYGITDYPDSTLHCIYDGDYYYQFFGSAKLDKLLEQVENGEFIIIGYKGIKKISGKRTMKDWKVLKAKA